MPVAVRHRGMAKTVSNPVPPRSSFDELALVLSDRLPRPEITDVRIPYGVRLHVIVNELRNGGITADRVFDLIYPDWVRAPSSQFWTPLAVAQRAARILATDASSRVLDVGSGAGKFCLVGALSTSAQFVGIEQRRHLVEVARAISREYGTTRATYIHGDIRDIDWREFNAFYFFNPFGENYFGGEERLDDSVELTPERFERDLRFAMAALSEAQIGTRVVTYHGLGRDFPPSYERVFSEPAGSDGLELWIRARG